MGKLKASIIFAIALVCVFLTGSSTGAGSFLRGAAVWGAGGDFNDVSGQPEHDTSAQSSAGSVTSTAQSSSSVSAVPHSTSQAGAESSSAETPNEPPIETARGNIIVKNRADNTDDTDYSQFTNKSGIISRFNFGYFDDPNIITLSSGAQIRNYTDEENDVLAHSAEELPDLGEVDLNEPTVLIYHTHTTESFMPFGDTYDPDYPISTTDSARNMTAVGDALCEALAKRGISCVHDCTVHDSPMFTGAYYRSADTLLENLEEYPQIKIAIDLHRDGIQNADGSAVAPTAEINGKTAAQFMIITGCDSPETEIPDYMTNFKLACLIQNCAENACPTLARPVLFDYRNYNQSLFRGDILIEVGSQANSLEEAVYTGELLGDIIADSLEVLAGRGKM